MLYKAFNLVSHKRQSECFDVEVAIPSILDIVQNTM